MFHVLRKREPQEPRAAADVDDLVARLGLRASEDSVVKTLDAGSAGELFRLGDVLVPVFGAYVHRRRLVLVGCRLPWADRPPTVCRTEAMVSKALAQIRAITPTWVGAPGSERRPG
jgi:hypothetical protein